jgi:hypothetical protein
MSLQDKYFSYCLSFFPDEKKIWKIEELDTYNYIFFLSHLLGISGTDAFCIACDYKLYRSECGPVGFGKELTAAAFIYRFQCPIKNNISKYEICEKGQINISSFERMLRKIDKDIFQNKYLCRVYCRAFYCGFHKKYVENIN